MEGPCVGSFEGGANPSINAAMTWSCSVRGRCSDFTAGSGWLATAGGVTRTESLRVSTEAELLELESVGDVVDTVLMIIGRSRFDTTVTILFLN